MAAKQAYKICLAEKDISKAVADAWPELGRYQENYYCLLEDYNILKESVCSADKKAEEHRAKLTELYEKLDSLSKTNWNNSKVVHEAGIPTIGGSHILTIQKRIIADPPASLTGLLPKPLGKSDVHDSEMHRLYVKGRALQPHEQSSDHTAVIFCIDEYARSMPSLPKNLMARHDDPNWMTDVIQSFNMNPSGIPQILHLEGLHVNVNDADVWYWLNLIKPKHHGAEAETTLQSIFSTVERWDQLIAGQWKRNDNPFLCSQASVRYTIHHNQKFDRGTFTYWLGCKAGVTPGFAREKLEPYFVHRVTKLICNEITLRSQLRANEIALLKGGSMNQFRVHEDLLPLVRESPFYIPPNVGEPMDQDESDPEPTPSQPTAGSSSLADRLVMEKKAFSPAPQLMPVTSRNV
ncbi:hypothetical protein M422DRAFT_270110 [Sphaerobolus stellatus SS14]|uniref:Uncharacterized protein n=1 Tax=Sphaerobolus stellatus (strain SS14) TaxID=990650 RepID=A0A0C9UTU1_SPHS4|nr:hypothetical protein M422DRAFT_270110 [Sphaerobolus stellatus SS14]